MPVASPEMKTELSTRLHRIEGQVRGVERMIQEDRECQQVLQQMAAIRSAVHQASLLLARDYLVCVLAEAGQEASDDLLDRLMATLAKID
jgi:CsoR family transcriptional regulator, copper-sensing transcriptional repressor